MAVGVRVLLAVDNDGLVPRPLSLNKGTVLRLVRVKLGELVALVVGSDVEDRDVVLATDDESTLNDGVVVGSVDGGASEEVLAGALETVVEAADEVVGHEGHGKLIVVLVGNLPDGVLVEFDVLPEPGEGSGGLAVGILALPLIERKGSLGQSFKRVLSLGGGSRLLLLLSGGLGGGGSLGSGLGLLRLLGGSVGQDGSLQEGELLGDGSVDGLVNNGLVPSSNSGVLLAPLLVEEVLEAAVEEASAEEISQGDALTNEVGVVSEVLLSSVNSTGNLLGEVIDSLLVVGGGTGQGLDPSTDLGGDLGVEVGHPSEDGSVASNLLDLRR